MVLVVVVVVVEGSKRLLARSRAPHRTGINDVPVVIKAESRLIPRQRARCHCHCYACNVVDDISLPSSTLYIPSFNVRRFNIRPLPLPFTRYLISITTFLALEVWLSRKGKKGRKGRKS